MPKEYGTPSVMSKLAFDPLVGALALRRFDNVAAYGVSGNPTGAVVFEIPGGFNNHMQFHEFVGYHYASGKGAYRVTVSFYSYNVGPVVVNPSVYYDASIPGDAIMRPQVRIGRRIATGNPVIIFGDIATNTWQYPRINLKSSWISQAASTDTFMDTIAVPVLVTDLSGYDLVVSPQNTTPGYDAATAFSVNTVPIARGGTNGSATPTAGGVAYGTGAAFGFTAAGTSGFALASGGAGAPTWVDLALSYVTLATVQTITGAKTLQPASAAVIPLTFKGAASQSADLTQWQKSDGTVLGRVLPGGEHQIIMPTGTADAAPAALYMKGFPSQLGKPFIRVESSNGSELTQLLGGLQTWFSDNITGGAFAVSWDYWTDQAGTAPNANVRANAGVPAVSAFRATRDPASAAGAHVAEFGVRSAGNVDTVNAYVTMEGNISAPRVMNLNTPQALGDAATKAYVDGSLEVAVGPYPVSPPATNFDLWVDTDDVGAAAPAGPLGKVAFVQWAPTTDPNTTFTSVIDIPSMSVTWTADPTRLYQITVSGLTSQITNAGNHTLTITDAANNLDQQYPMGVAVNGWITWTAVLYKSGVSGSITRKARIQSSIASGGLRARTDYPWTMIVEDIGAA